MSAGSVSWPSSSATIASVGSNNSPIPASSDLAGAKDPSGNLQPLLVDVSGNLKVVGSFTPPALQNVNLAQVNGSAIVLGQALEAASLPVTIASDQSAIPISASSLPLPTGGATSANQTTGNTSLATIATNTTGVSTAANQTTGNGSLATIATNTAGVALDSHLTNVQSAPGTPQTVALTVQGNASGVPIPVSGSFSASITDLVVTGAATQTATVNNILTASSGSAATTVDGYKSASVQVVSTGTGGAFIFEGSNDNVNFQTIPVYNQIVTAGTPIVAAITPTASQLIYTFPITTNFIRLRISTLVTGGSIQAFSRFSQLAWDTAVVQVAQGTAANLNATVAGTVTSNQGTAAVVANSWYAKISDATTGPVKVQAASTAPAAADIALTVALSPNGVSPKSAGRALANAPTVTTYATPVTSGAYVTIIASTTSATNLVEIFDSSGVAIFFAVGAAASEVNQFVIYPGGNGQVPLSIPAGSRISYKAVSASATGSTAYNVLNLYT